LKRRVRKKKRQEKRRRRGKRRRKRGDEMDQETQKRGYNGPPSPSLERVPRRVKG